MARPEIAKETGSQKIWLWILLGSIFFLLFSIFVLYTIRNLETATPRFSSLGFKALPAILIYSIFQTALPEEILFRGFLLKRLASRLPFRVANTLQAALFGLLHGLMFASQTTWLTSMLIILFTGESQLTWALSMRRNRMVPFYPAGAHTLWPIFCWSLLGFHADLAKLEKAI